VEDEKGYTTSLITEHALAFVKKNKSNPFCLYLAYEAPHDPYQGPNDPAIRVQGKVVPNKYAEGQIPRAYREMVQTMDTGIGKILELLKTEELDRKTFVFFLSDNGSRAVYGKEDIGCLRLPGGPPRYHPTAFVMI
jgi:arylsulfatase A-like enzyme